MGSSILALVAIVCGAAALYFWTTLAKLQEQITKLTERAEKAERDEGKAQERAEQLRKKLEKTGEAVSKDDRAQKEAAARLAQSKEDVAKARGGAPRFDALLDLRQELHVERRDVLPDRENRADRLLRQGRLGLVQGHDEELGDRTGVKNGGRRAYVAD